MIFFFLSHCVWFGQICPQRKTKRNWELNQQKEKVQGEMRHIYIYNVDKEEVKHYLYVYPCKFALC